MSEDEGKLEELCKAIMESEAIVDPIVLKSEILAAIRSDLEDVLSKRDKRLIQNCISYALNDPAGLPGHNLCLIVDQLARAIGF